MQRIEDVDHLAGTILMMKQEQCRHVKVGCALRLARAAGQVEGEFEDLFKSIMGMLRADDASSAIELFGPPFVGGGNEKKPLFSK